MHPTVTVQPAKVLRKAFRKHLAISMLVGIIGMSTLIAADSLLGSSVTANAHTDKHGHPVVVCGVTAPGIYQCGGAVSYHNHHYSHACELCGG